jgi:hypothetical protein
MTNTTHRFELVADHGDGESRSILERRDDGVIVLTTNAESRQPVTPLQFSGPGWDTLETANWLERLTEQFDSSEAAEIFVQAAGRDLP